MTFSTVQWTRRALTATVFAALVVTLMVAPAQAEDRVDDPLILEALLDVPGAPPELPADVPDKSGLIDGELRDIYDRWVAGEETPGITDGRIRVEVIPAAPFEALDSALAAFGAEDTVNLDVENEFGGLAVTTLVVADLLEIEALPEVTQLRVPLVLSASDPEEPVVGEESEAVAGAASPEQWGKGGNELVSRVRAAKWHKAGVRGAGVKVGIIDGFGRGYWNAAQSAGAVKKPSGTFCRINGVSCNLWEAPGDGAHGAAVAEAILDVAPDAKIYLANVRTMEDHKAAVDYFASKGVRIINRSQGAWYDGRGDGTGPAASVLDYAVKKKITWFNSAGNQGVEPAPQNSSGFVTSGGYWRGEWRDTDGNGWLEFTDPQGRFAPAEVLHGVCAMTGRRVSRSSTRRIRAVSASGPSTSSPRSLSSPAPGGRSSIDASNRMLLLRPTSSRLLWRTASTARVRRHPPRPVRRR